MNPWGKVATGRLFKLSRITASTYSGGGKGLMGRFYVVTAAIEEVGVDADYLFAKGVIYLAGEEATVDHD